MEADSEREGPNRKRVLTPEQRKQDAIRCRLARAAKWIAELEQVLGAIHSDRSGMYHHLLRLPTTGPAAGAYRALKESLERIEREAGQGCARSADWLLRHAERLGWIEYHIAKRPPPRDPAWKPAPIVFPHVPRAPWRPRRSDFDHWHPHLDRNTDGD